MEKFASKSVEDHEKFVKCKNNLRSLTRTLRKDFEKALANKNQEQPEAILIICSVKTED